MELLIALALAAVLGWFVSAPLRRGPAPGGEEPRKAELEAAKEAKYRQIRDAELDREQGKLSQEDWERIDAELRREAIELLKELDRL
jgi:hypothetical protein